MKTTREKIAVMQAYADGKKIEIFDRNEWAEWIVPNEPEWDWGCFDYRIKPEPKYRPYENADEFITAQKEHGMYLCFISNCAYKLATGITKWSVAILWDYPRVEEISYVDLFKRATWQDGTPCGILEE